MAGNKIISRNSKVLYNCWSFLLEHWPLAVRSPQVYWELHKGEAQLHLSGVLQLAMPTALTWNLSAG
jgi:hypothetical protein